MPPRSNRLRNTLVSLASVAVLLPFSAAASGAQSQDPGEILGRALADFQAGRLEESVAGFDRFVEVSPETAPYLWQRGIALYYVGRYDDCRAQFESHLTVNPADVENSAWHFLCVARLESPQAARAALLPVGPDSREPMTEIYEMFRGDRPPEELLPAVSIAPRARFYAHLYLGLYYEALGREREAYENILAAADDDYIVGGYMNTVAKVHLALLQRTRLEPVENSGLAGLPPAASPPY